MGIIDDISILTNNSQKKIMVKCDFNVSKYCRGQYYGMWKNIRKFYILNNNKILCNKCRSIVKRSCRNNSGFGYNFDHFAMDNIDTLQKAYLLGWIATDGSISNNRIVEIGLHPKDRLILTNMFEAVFGKNIPTVKLRKKYKNKSKIIKNSTPSARITLCSRQVSQSILKHLGLVTGNKKTFDLKCPVFTNSKLMFSFLRGVVEGDGTISKQENRKCSPGKLSVRIFSMSLDFLYDISKFLIKSNIPNTIVNNSNIFCLSINSWNAIKFLREIYPKNIDSKQVLVRKYKIANFWISSANEIEFIKNIKNISRNTASRVLNKKYKKK